MSIQSIDEWHGYLEKFLSTAHPLIKSTNTYKLYANHHKLNFNVSK